MGLAEAMESASRSSPYSGTGQASAPRAGPFALRLARFNSCASHVLPFSLGRAEIPCVSGRHRRAMSPSS